jgi:hypothetical protein
VPFAPYDAIYREAVVSSSPFYRLLCAFRIYDGTTEIRRWLRQHAINITLRKGCQRTPKSMPRNCEGLATKPKWSMELGEREIYLSVSGNIEMRLPTSLSKANKAKPTSILLTVS